MIFSDLEEADEEFIPQSAGVMHAKAISEVIAEEVEDEEEKEHVLSCLEGQKSPLLKKNNDSSHDSKQS